MRFLIVIILAIILANAVYKNLYKEKGEKIITSKKSNIETEKAKIPNLEIEPENIKIPIEEISLSPNSISNIVPDSKIITKNIEVDKVKDSKSKDNSSIEKAISRIKTEWKDNEVNKKIRGKYDLVEVIPSKPLYEVKKPTQKQENLFENDDLLSATENKKKEKPFDLAIISDVADKTIEGLDYLTQPIIKPIQAIANPRNYIGNNISVSPLEKIASKPASLNVKKDQDFKSSPLLFSKPPKSVTNINRNQYISKVVANVNNPKKRQFISSVGNATAEINQKILNERNSLIYVFKRFENGFPLTDNERKWINNLAVKYKVQNFNISNKAKRDELLSKINIIPESLAIAQGALESGWGSSKLAREGFNFFGMKCNSSNCSNRNSNYAFFDSPKDAVENYVHNLNTNSAYQNFRIARKNLGSNINGLKLAGHLDGYAQNKAKYQSQLTEIITYNKLEN
ncbi:MAG: glucosaminidase domain-containing protein [Rickettsiales bacterium]|nr:glucosaminidase domain-containing protein [Rickettsiales bacterium]